MKNLDIKDRKKGIDPEEEVLKKVHDILEDKKQKEDRSESENFEKEIKSISSKPEPGTLKDQIEKTVKETINRHLSKTSKPSPALPSPSESKQLAKKVRIQNEIAKEVRE